jgi:hypothetical protein
MLGSVKSTNKPIARLHDMRVLENLRSIFSDVLYEVYEQRKKSKSLYEP